MFGGKERGGGGGRGEVEEGKEERCTTTTGTGTHTIISEDKDCDRGMSVCLIVERGATREKQGWRERER